MPQTPYLSSGICLFTATATGDTSQLSGDPEELYISIHKTSFTGTGNGDICLNALPDSV